MTRRRVNRTPITTMRSLITITRTLISAMRSLITITRTLISAVPGGALPGVFHEVQHDARRQREQRHEAEAMLRHNSSAPFIGRAAPKSHRGASANAALA